MGWLAFRKVGRQVCSRWARRQVERQVGWQADRHVGRQAGVQAGGCAVGQVGIQVGRQASFEPAEGRLQKLVRNKYSRFYIK